MKIRESNGMAEKVLRFVSICQTTGCWIWMGGLDSGHYGKVLVRGRCTGAHRASYEAFRGPIPAGLDIDHLCRHRWCVNPDHLEPVTRRENALRGAHPHVLLHHANQCKRGHALTPDNLVSRGRGVTKCRRCKCDMDRRSYWARKASRLAKRKHPPELGEPVEVVK